MCIAPPECSLRIAPADGHGAQGRQESGRGSGEDIMGDNAVKSTVKKMVKKGHKQAVKEASDDAGAKEE